MLGAALSSSTTKQDLAVLPSLLGSVKEQKFVSGLRGQLLVYIPWELRLMPQTEKRLRALGLELGG